MGKSRDELLWQLGKKPSTKSDEDAYRDHLSRQAKEGKLTQAAEEALEKLKARQSSEDLSNEKTKK